jgi:hypothetical protein
MNVPLLVAGSLAILGAAIHGVGGEVLVRKLTPGTLPSSPFGGPRATKTMIHVTWHMTTVAFLTVGSALLLSGSVLHGDTARGIGLLAAGASTGFAALAVGLGAAHARSLRSLFRSLFLHPGPTALTATGAGVVGSSLRKMRLAATANNLAMDRRPHHSLPPSSARAGARCALTAGARLPILRGHATPGLAALPGTIPSWRNHGPD